MLVTFLFEITDDSYEQRGVINIAFYFFGLIIKSPLQKTLAEKKCYSNDVKLHL
jgi:hypothetical protein